MLMPKPQSIAAAKEPLAEANRLYPTTPINQEAIDAALELHHPYFITTSLYWDCSCAEDYIHPAGSGPCPRCNDVQDEMPDSRIGEMAFHGINLEWLNPEIINTYDEHNPMSRPRLKKNDN